MWNVSLVAPWITLAHHEFQELCRARLPKERDCGASHRLSQIRHTVLKFVFLYSFSHAFLLIHRAASKQDVSRLPHILSQFAGLHHEQIFSFCKNRKKNAVSALNFAFPAGPVQHTIPN